VRQIQGTDALVVKAGLSIVVIQLLLTVISMMLELQEVAASFAITGLISIAILFFWVILM